jgi:hypothetical protein
VIFCSAFFARLFQVPLQRITLTKADGSESAPLQVGSGDLSWKGQRMNVVIAPTFAKQGLARKLMEAYGTACRDAVATSLH